MRTGRATKSENKIQTESSSGEAKIFANENVLFYSRSVDFVKAHARTVDFVKAHARTVDFAKAHARTVDFVKSHARTVDFARIIVILCHPWGLNKVIARCTCLAVDG